MTGRLKYKPALRILVFTLHLQKYKGYKHMKLLSLLTASILFFITACSGTSASRSDAPIRVGEKYGYTNMVTNPDEMPSVKGGGLRVIQAISRGLKNEACESIDRLGLRFFVSEEGTVLDIIPVGLDQTKVTEQMKACAATIVPDVNKVRFHKPTFNGMPVKTVIVLIGNRKFG